MPVSVLILTYNEEANLPACLESVAWCDDVVVLDSYSQDKTAAIAEAAGVRFFQRDFDNYAGQRSYGINEINYKYPWVLMVDADEVVSDGLVSEINNVLASVDDEVCLFRMRRKDYFLGKWIRFSSGYPTWFGRLMRIGRVRIERAVNEEYHTDGRIGLLREHLIHYPFNKGFQAWLEKHNRYSTMEAEAIMSGASSAGTRNRLAWLFHHDPSLRRKAVKRIFYRLPARPLLMFISLYFIRGGLLEGRAGFTYCMLRAWYEYMINCKVREIKRRRRGLAL